MELKKMELKYIGTTNGTYLTAGLEDKGNTLILKGAMPIDKGRIGQVSKNVVEYMTKELSGEIMEITVYKSSLESIVDAKGESVALSVMVGLAPEAERRARGKMVYAELGQLIKTIIG